MSSSPLPRAGPCQARRVTGPARSAPDRCPCGSGETYDACCGRFHRREGEAPTAEALMRSRYSAFVVGDVEHLLRTWHPSTRPARLELDADQRWTGLEVLATSAGGPFDADGTVEFTASSVAGGRRAVHRERSRFVREDRRWSYVDGR